MAWTEAARQAALEARRRNAKNKNKITFGGRGRRGKMSLVDFSASSHYGDPAGYSTKQVGARMGLSLRRARQMQKQSLFPTSKSFK